MTIEAVQGVISEPVIREATVADLPACAEIINDYIDSTEWLPRTKPREEIAGLFTPELLEKRTVLVVEIDGEIAAYMSVADGFIFSIYIARQFRGEGLGKALIDQAKLLHPNQLELTAFELNTDAQRFYRREGFSEVPEGRKDDTDEGIPILLMRWRRGA